MKFKPKPIPTLMTIAGLVLLLSLGSWQMSRLQWKRTLVKEINEGAALPAVELLSDRNEIEKFKYRRVKVRGEFLHDKEVHLFVGPKAERGRPGYDILTPLKIEEGNYVLVDRGWVNSDIKSPEKRPETLEEGMVEIEGIIHAGETPGRFTPENDVAKNLWFWIDLDEIENYAGINLQNFYVRALKKDKKNIYPIASDEFIKVRNDHLQYAVTWYSLAIILLVIYFLYSRKAEK
ncbi:MAG: SURF1 family protein [Rickettsiales bacterium]|nr:SURF1 family protein [Pseudomonadota bacterium]MDA0965579.1 SURF1 family protein [Pseudomonadota bacterium]MDG4542903.1 SURF1 family protein [Rickettsiales bacterium]MDG4544649.1 SURF1 family protein [Rickettsiales bacterium]MDG4546771.1 SURF1 family protein [Rickettsiales bacterium]